VGDIMPSPSRAFIRRARLPDFFVQHSSGFENPLPGTKVRGYTLQVFSAAFKALTWQGGAFTRA
jgi:hypothetical protein